MNTMKPWLNALISAGITGAVTAVGVGFLDPHHDFILLSPLFLKVLAGGAVLGIINHLRTSPWPGMSPSIVQDDPHEPAEAQKQINDLKL